MCWYVAEMAQSLYVVIYYFVIWDTLVCQMQVWPELEAFYPFSHSHLQITTSP